VELNRGVEAEYARGSWLWRGIVDHAKKELQALAAPLLAPDLCGPLRIG
jgi:hypothetical protein